MQSGLVHIYCGDGKGKTTAAMGLAVRAAGNDFKVVIVQFLKSSQTGELKTLAAIPQITILRGDENCTFTFKMDEEMKRNCFSAHSEIFHKAVKMCEDGHVDLLVLDEVVGAYNSDLIDKEKLVDFIKNKPNHLEIVMTGRNPSEELTQLCDYVSEIKKIKHPFDKGIQARVGIEK